MGSVTSASVDIYITKKGEKQVLDLTNLNNLFSASKNKFTTELDMEEENILEMLNKAKITDENYKDFNFLILTDEPDDYCNTVLIGKDFQQLDQLISMIEIALNNYDKGYDYEGIFALDTKKIGNKEVGSLSKESFVVHSFNENGKMKHSNIDGFVFRTAGREEIESIYDDCLDIYYDDENESEKTFSKKELQKIIDKMGATDKLTFSVTSNGTN